MYSFLSKFFTVLLFLFITLSVQAQETLEPVVVTATRSAQTIDETMASVTVITRDDIEASNAKDLVELLSLVKGLDLRQSGSYGKNTSLYMRGTSGSHTKVLIDGVKIYSATAGATTLQHLPLSQIDHIEIVRGPRSSLYGSEAIGGVIQIFTRKGSEQTLLSASVGIGSNNTKELTAGLSGSVNKLTYSVNFGKFETDGIDAITHTSSNDKDGYDNQSFNSQVSYKFDTALALELHLLNAQGTNAYDNCFNSASATSDDCSNDFKQQSISSKIIFTPEGIWDVNLIVGSSTDEDSNFWESLPDNTFKTELTSVSFLNNLQIREHQLVTFGVDYTDDKVSATPYPTSSDYSRDNTGVFVAWNSTYNKLDVNSSLRQDNNQQFGAHTTGNIALAYITSSKLRFIASYGTAFKAPTFNELYYPQFGRTDLKPENSSSVELALKRKEQWGRWDVSLYQTTIDNLIAYDSTTNLAGNISKAEITGVEAEIATKLAGWDIHFTGTYLEPLNKDAANKNKILQARAQDTVQIVAQRQFGKIDFSATVLSQGKRYENTGNTKKVSAYTVLDLRVAYQLDRKNLIDIKIKNALDKDYIINTPYNTLGRTFFATLNYTL